VVIAKKREADHYKHLYFQVILLKNTLLNAWNTDSAPENGALKQ
jgi:hypothetical protein